MLNNKKLKYYTKTQLQNLQTAEKETKDIEERVLAPRIRLYCGPMIWAAYRSRDARMTTLRQKRFIVLRHPRQQRRSSVNSFVGSQLLRTPTTTTLTVTFWNSRLSSLATPEYST